MVKVALVLGIVSCLLSCSAKKTDSLLSYSLENVSAIDLNASYSLDSLVEEMKLIPLETTDSCLIDDVTFLKESADYFFVYSNKNSKLLKFDKNGKYLSTISNKGQGPEEYLSVKNLMLDDANNELYIMDYFGRKMKVFGFDGCFHRAYPLPEDFAYTNSFLSLTEKAIYYASSNNSVQVDFLKYDLNTLEFVPYSHREREMDKGEYFVGQTLFGNTDTYPLVYHYFNDTVFQVTSDGLMPHHKLVLGDRTLSWEDFKADAFNNPRPQVHKIQVWGLEMVKDKVCVFYSLSKFKGEKQPVKLIAVYTLDKQGIEPHVNWTSDRFIPIMHGAGFQSGYQRTSLLRSVLPEELDGKLRKEYSIKIDDNPIILKYYLK